jgi:predicted aspartyl protease
VDAYKLAEEKANSARNLSQSALTEDDWNLVSSRWQQAIAALQSVPPSSPYQAITKTKRLEFEKELAAARQRAKQAKTNTSQTPLISSNAQPLNVSSAVIRSSLGAGTVYRAPIKRRAGGTPIIDVTFNGNQTFEMIVDTGASGTVITPSMAQALGVQVVGKTKVNTASQTGVEVPLGYIHSIAVSGAVVKEVIVAIGSDALDVGLLGHDFFDDFDVTVKQDVVEFRRR